MPGELVPDWLARRAVTHRGRPALTFGGTTWTFGHLDALAGNAAGALAALGIAPGDRVALLARNSPGFVVTVHAVARTGAILLPLNRRLAPAELAWQLRDADAAILLCDAAEEDAARQASDLAGGVPVNVIVDRGPEPGAGAGSLPGTALSLAAVQGIVFTSGTTGQPKAAQLTFGNWWSGASGSALHIGHRHDDRWLAALPLFHVGGLAILFRSVIGGVPVTLLDGFDPEEARRVIARDRVTLVSVVAATLRSLLETPGNDDDVRSLRVALLGGGPAPAMLVEEALARNVPVAPTYGLTEASSQVATLLPEEARRLPGSSGSPLPQVDVRIERHGQKVPTGSEGEIAVRGPSVTPGYRGLNTIPPDGWFRTGDIGRLDEDGRLFVLDRRDDIIVSGGENVYPAEVEAVLLRHPSVREAAVVGAPDDRWGSVPIAFVAFRAGPRPADREVLEQAAGTLARFKLPRRIVAIDALPRNAAGKILRRVLRTRATNESESV